VGAASSADRRPMRGKGQVHFQANYLASGKWSECAFMADFGHVRERLGDPTPGQVEHKQSYQAASLPDCEPWRHFHTGNGSIRLTLLSASSNCLRGTSRPSNTRLNCQPKPCQRRERRFQPFARSRAGLSWPTAKSGLHDCGAEASGGESGAASFCYPCVVPIGYGTFTQFSIS